LPIKYDPTNVWQISGFTACADGSADYYCAAMSGPVEAGKYVLFLYNAIAKYKESEPPFTFTATVDYINQEGGPNVLEPEFGSDTVQLGTMNELSRIAPLPKVWILVGEYTFTGAGTLSVKVGPIPSSVEAVDLLVEKLILVKADDAQLALIPTIPGYRSVSILDDDNLVPNPPPDSGVDMQYLLSETKIPMDSAWNGSFTRLKKGVLLSPGVLPEGTYLVCFSVPQGVAPFDYKLEIKGGILNFSSIEVNETAPSNGAYGNWNCLTNPENLVKVTEPVHLLFEFFSSAGAVDGIPVDAVLVYKQDQ